MKSVSTNTVRSVTFARRGQRAVVHLADDRGDAGYALTEVPEDGYVVELADCRVFVGVRELRAARRAAR